VTAEKPFFSVYCHCIECRKAHGSPMYSTALFPASAVVVTEGEDLITRYTPPNSKVQFSRSFCSRCASRVINHMTSTGEFLPAGDYRGIFHGSLNAKPEEIPEAFRPTAHIWCKEALVDLTKLNDNLPQFPEFPTPSK
jgi:hypothetical protein